MAMTQEQLDTLKKQTEVVEATFGGFAKARLATHNAYEAYRVGQADKWFGRDTAKNDDIMLSEVISAKRQGKQALRYPNYIVSPEAKVVLDLVDKDMAAEKAFLAARNAYAPDASKNTEAFIIKVQERSASGQLATPENTIIKSNTPGNEGKDIAFARVIAASRKYLADREKEAAGHATEVKAAEEAAKARENGLESLEETTKLVSKGIIINIDGKSKAHEPARVEIAQTLEKYFKGLTGQGKTDAYSALSIPEGYAFELRNEKGNEISDRKLLGKMLRLFQKNKGLVVDGKVGLATLDYLLDVSNVGSVALPLVQQVAQTVGHLGGKANPFALQGYKDGEDSDPKQNARKQGAYTAMDDAKEIIAALGAKIKDQADKVGDGYTQNEHDALTALFAEGSKLDPKNLTNGGVQAFEKAFGLKVDKGVIGPEVARALDQIKIRLATDQVIDPSEIKAAVLTNAKPAAKPAASK